MNTAITCRATVMLPTPLRLEPSRLRQADVGDEVLPVAKDPSSILIIDDSPEIRALVSGSLEAQGYEVRAVADGEAGLAEIEEREPDVVVLDVGLPGIDGTETCRRLRLISDTYVIMLTVKDDQTDLLIGLAVGADDYITKPFSPDELSARIRTLLRRPRALAGTPVAGGRTFGELTIDADAREVRLADAEITLTRIEFDLLDTLTAHPRTVFSRGTLLEKIWGPMWFGDEHVVDVHIAELRRKLGDDARSPKYIKTMRGVGYRMAGPPAA